MFSSIAQDYFYLVHELQIGRSNGSAVAKRMKGSVILPDVLLLGQPNEFHEIKVKRPNKHGCYGLEKYRLRSLVELAGQVGDKVMYTIYDWQLAGATSADRITQNDIGYWRTADVLWLADRVKVEAPGRTWRNGRQKVESICYWPAQFWTPLSQVWEESNMQGQLGHYFETAA